MGTKYYFFTKDKEEAIRFFPDSYELVDYPDFGYIIHIAKTSGGWKPLFQQHKSINCVSDIKKVFLSGDFTIYNEEFAKKMTWEEFEDLVINWQKKGNTLRHTDLNSKYESIGTTIPCYFYEDREGYDFSRMPYS